MDEFCGTEFWNYNTSWYAENPDFTPCFHETALVWVPCAFLVLLSPFEFFRISKTPTVTNRVPWTLLSLMKLFLVLALAVLSSIEMLDALTYLAERRPVDYYTPLIKVVTFSFASVLMSLNRKRHLHASGLVFLFWLLAAVGSILTYRSVLLDTLDPDSMVWNVTSLVYVVRISEATLATALLLSCCFSDSLPLSITTPGQDFKNPSPEWSAPFLSRLLFTWFDDLVKRGYKTPVVLEDCYDLSSEFKSAPIFDKYCENWSYPENANILKPLLKTFWPRLLSASLLQLIATILTFVSPSVLDYILVWLDNDEPYWHGFFYAGLLFGAPMLRTFINSQYSYMVTLSGMQMKTAVVGALHRKALRMSPKAKTDFTTGQIVNLMSVDSQSIVGYVNFANNWWISPLQVSIAMYMLWQQLGVATLAGILVMILLIPVNGYVAARMKSAQRKVMKAKDKRSKLINEIINGIKVLKMYAWENSLCDQVKTFRSKEIDELKKQTKYMAFVFFSVGCTPIFVALATFFTYTLLDENNVLDPSKTFVSISLLNIIMLPLAMVPFVINGHTTFLVAQKRINAFFNCDELDPEDIGRSENGEIAIEVTNGKFSWGGTSSSTLRNVNLKIEKNKLVAVVGTVGSGKSSLVSALLGEMEKIRGKVNVSGRVAYVPQQAWIQNATVKNNIVFTGAADTAKYEDVLNGCALRDDLKILGAGDQTEIGEKGINLSGGQKQRVSLARAVYADCDVYLLDDPLSAVDSHVGKHIFDQVIGPKGMLKNTTRILVTHKVALMPHVDEIIVMKDGLISEQGSYLQLLQQKGAFAEFLVEYLAEQDGEDDDDLEEIKNMVRPELERHLSVLSERSEKNATSGRKTLSIVSDSRSRKELERRQSMKGVARAAIPKGRLVETESAETGSVKLSVYANYARAIGVTSCVALLLGNVTQSGLGLASSLWLSAWSNDGSDPEKVSDVQLRYVRLAVYAALGISQAALVYFINLTTFYATLKASKFLHNAMLDHIIRAPMSFFDTTPLGRILNRFGKDIENIDSSIRMSITQFVAAFFQTIVTFTIISLETPLFLVPLVPLFLIYYIVQKYYIKTSRQLRRLESNSRSPVYSHFAETVSGTNSIRAYRVENHFNLECDRKNDINNTTNILCTAAVRWLSIRLEFLGNVIVLLAALFAVYARGDTLAATVGLSLSYALSATGSLNSLVTSSADLENNLVSVERCIEYTETPTEAPAEVEETKPKSSWPDNGIIEFKDYATRYRDGLDLVLKNLTFGVKAGEKVGIVGRTGAGKSSLTVALFRIVEPANGTIVIDGVDVTRIGLHSLRSGLTIIPQDPVLFTGSLRLNLDPFSVHDDSELWTALKLAHLQQFVDSLSNGLEFEISEGGENLSVGQRQLVCLARALLRKSKILILDEATAAVDLETDDLIQKTIREQFADCTILTIAHRLNTILDYDRVLVMDKGTISEYDTPKILLDNTASIFHSMAKDAGLVAAAGNEVASEKPETNTDLIQ
ncbi:ATP-binding cassette sub-family C member 3 [Halotydeus destructor]|nr:ATP-binding cassette sub-family C member 3 [Halotydeus destructor]